MENNASASYRFAIGCMAQLASSGVKTVVASPGFRNSPLMLAAHRTRGLDVVSAVDERGAAFLALGIARTQRLPVALLCTSGTAVGNYLPAVMEANHSKIPLLILTGDRPPELVGTGANQCTDQSKLFGTHVRSFLDSAPPSGAEHEKNHAGYLIGKAVAQCTKPVPGPVHVNLRFREPFLPAAEECARLESEERPRAWSFLGSSTGPGEDQAFAINSLLGAAKRPLFILGPGSHGPRLLGRLCDLSSRHGIPILAEAASGIAYCENPGQRKLIHRADACLAAMSRGDLTAPDLFIRIGAPLTGRAYPGLLSKANAAQLIFEEWGEAREPGFHPSIFVEGGAEEWLSESRVWADASADPAWAESLLAFDAREEERLEAYLKSYQPFTEWHFHRSLAGRMNPGVQLFLGNSMPIRDFNSVFPQGSSPMRIFSNRGLSGIDGLIASAAGVAYGSGFETHAVLGDLSTLHDLPSLALVSSLRHRLNLTLWVMNNEGGEIFRIVQTANAGSPPEWFTTPQEYDLPSLAKTFRLSFLRVHDQASLDSLEPSLFAGGGVRLIEVMAGGKENVAIRKSFREGS